MVHSWCCSELWVIKHLQGCFIPQRTTTRSTHTFHLRNLVNTAAHAQNCWPCPSCALGVFLLMDLDADITESYKVGFKAPTPCKIKFNSIFQQQNRALTCHWTPSKWKRSILCSSCLLHFYESKGKTLGSDNQPFMMSHKDTNTLSRLVTTLSGKCLFNTSKTESKPHFCRRLWRAKHAVFGRSAKGFSVIYHVRLLHKTKIWTWA